MRGETSLYIDAATTNKYWGQYSVAGIKVFKSVVRSGVTDEET